MPSELGTPVRRADQLAALAELGERALAGGDPVPLLQETCALVVATLAVSYGSIWELAADGRYLLLRAGSGWEVTAIGRERVGAGSASQAGYTLLTRRPVALADAATESRFRLPAWFAERGVVSGLSVPIRGQDQPYGALAVHATERRTFTRDDIHFLQAVASQLATAVQRRRMVSTLRQYMERLGSMQEMNRAILASGSFDGLAHAALKCIRTLVPCLRAGIALLDVVAGDAVLVAVEGPEQTRLGPGARLPLALLGGLEEFRQGKVHQVARLLPDADMPPVLQIAYAEGARSYFATPLLVRGELIGWLILWADRPDYFTSKQIDFAREAANQVAIALQQARWHEQVERQLEQRVAERTAQLQETNAEMESFSYSVSHDLRAPLRAMHGFADALLEDYAGCLDATGQDYARRIVAAAQRMDSLIQDLLAYSRISRAQYDLQAVDLALVAADVCSQYEVELRDRHAQVTVAEPLHPVIGHHATLVQIVSNLLTNAVKFVHAGVRPQVHIRAEKQGDWVRLWVADNGIGISPEHQVQIFRVFERLHGMETYPGTGIGLAIVRKGIERMGGRVGVESTLGQGSRFWIELPAGEMKP